jgi:hypothetical protein
MLVQIYMYVLYSTYIVQEGTNVQQANYAGPDLHVQYLHSTGRHEQSVSKLCWFSSTCMDTIQAGTNARQANYASLALHVWTPYRQA